MKGSQVRNSGLQRGAFRHSRQLYGLLAAKARVFTLEVGHMFRIRSHATAAVAATAVLFALLLPTLWSTESTASSAVLLGSSSVQPSPDNDAAGLGEGFLYTAQASGDVG